MIYLTVGTFPGGFNRLTEAVDVLCGKHNIECVAQIGKTSYCPSNMSFSDFYDSAQHNAYIASSQAIITHGGFGVIGDIMRLQKPFLIVPRRPEEGPNDQREMALRLAQMYNLNLCMDINDLESHFLKLINTTGTPARYNLDTNIPRLISDFLQTH